MARTRALPEMPLERFSWNPTDGKLVSEASDFGPMRQGLWWLGQLYEDACDAGIAIRSHKTGQVQQFVLVETLYSKDEDRELYGWRFAPLQPNSRVREVLIFND